MPQLLRSLLVTGLMSAASLAGGTPEQPDPNQILWQRDLGDALDLARAEGRKLLVVVNADGESASERIVRERYRDPAFVELTRGFVCVVGSVFRHNPRDVTFDGRRLECPRLGAVTCGEHIALEPLLHERFFAGREVVLDGEVVERISPRHRVGGPDDTGGDSGGAADPDFDLFLLFDMRVLDRELAAAALDQPAPGPGAGGPLVPTGTPARLRSSLRPVVRDRSAAGQALVEAMAREQLVPPHSLADAILHVGNARHTWALHLLTPRIGLERSSFVSEVIGASTQLAYELQGPLQARGLGVPLAADADGPVLEALARLDAAGTRTLRLSLEALPAEALARTLAAVAADPAPPPPPAEDDRPSAAEYEQLLESLDPSFRLAPDDPELQRDFGRALLGLARRRIEAGDGSAGFLLEDAASALDRAAEAYPRDFQLQLDRARCAYYRSDFEQQEAAAQAALAIDGLDLDQRTEAWRWLGDAGARLIVERSLGDEPTERVGIERTSRALLAAATGPEADATDWVSFASFLGATGRPGEQSAVARVALATFPDSDALRAVYAAGARWVGAPKHMAGDYEELAALHPESGASAWYAGWALMNLAEWQRRGERPKEALATYARAEPYFRKASELRPDFAGTSEHYLCMAALGRGFAHLIADERAEAAEALVEAVRIRPALRGERDGLDREAIDLVDGSLEWRRIGPSPVDGRALAERLIELDPTTGHWAGAVADALLREGLRAVERGEPGLGVEGLRASHQVARRALELEEDATSRRALAQSATCLAEVLMRQGLETAEPGPLLAEAAALLGQEGPASGASSADLTGLAEGLRAELGPARPISRPGR